MPAVDLTSPTAPLTFNTIALLIALGVGVGVLSACGILYKSLCLLLDWMDTKIEEKADLEYAPEIPDVGPLRPIIPPYLSFIPLPPPIYNGEGSYSHPAETSLSSSSCSFETIFLESSSNTSIEESLPVVEAVVIAPLQSPILVYDEPCASLENAELAAPGPTIEDSDSGANLAAILERIEELGSVHEPFAPLFQLSHCSSGLPKMENLLQLENGMEVKHLGSIKPPTPRTPKRKVNNSSGNINKENLRGSPSYMLPTAASRLRMGDTGSIRPGRRVL
ncbi:hypothetical protein HGRIS_013448 [Hohenbuehelia grisea]|uniref:Uncharacterized protein n=1 Tax=Hohenbuehelia grisea TaxID=104357 RepID=A0ABR3IVE9_9AGAR